eukprot:5367401-Pleurochrysis_carterae.AAC.1
MGDGGGRERTDELHGAGDVCARGSDVATVYARQAGQLSERQRHFLLLTNALVLPLPVLTSDRHAPRHA